MLIFSLGMNPIFNEDFTFDFQLQRNDPVRKLLTPCVITEDCRGGNVNRIKAESVRVTSHARKDYTRENLSGLT